MSASSAWDSFKAYFQDEDDTDDGLEECHEIMEFSRQLYYPKLIAYLEREADRPLQIGDQATMISSAVRGNTFKEVKAHLRKLVREAQMVIDREVRNG